MRRLLLVVLCWVAPVHAGPPDGAALMAQGRYAEARKKLEAAAQKPGAFEARFQLGVLYRTIGEQQLERTIWNRFYDDYERGRIDKKSARELAYVARAAQMLGGWKDANDTFRDAVDADPQGKDGARANIEWARLFLEKYDAGHAEVCLDEALKILPDDPEARTILAAVKLEQSYDTVGALRELDRAERVAPAYPEAEALRAKIALEGEDLVAALRIANALLTKNPEDLAAHTMLAGVALVDDDHAAFEEQRTRVLAAHPHASSFYHDLAELLVHEHRYADAVSLEEEGLRIDPKEPVSRADYGANLLRLGREADGMTALREAWKKDKYNVRTYNLLQLFEDIIPKAYTTIESPPFRLRVPVAERAVLEKTVVPLLHRAEQSLTTLYGFRPASPVTVELYTDPKHYAVRTVGLPGLDAIGVTFGSLITAMSPSVGKFDWGMVLWHELSHVYAIQLSKSRVPRWFTEGLSEYETSVADPLWTRRTSAELAAALERGQLLPIGQLDLAFLHARNLSQMVVSYHEAAAAVRYYIERAGRPGVTLALRRFAEGKHFADIVRETTGEDLSHFDTAFRAWLHEKLRGYAGQLILRPSDYSDLEGLEEAHRDHPNDARTAAMLALAQLNAGHLEAARAALPKTTAGLPEVAYAATRIAVAAHKLEDAKTSLALLRATGAHGCDVEVLAARVAKVSNDVDGAWTALQAAAAADPDRAEPWALMNDLASHRPLPKACPTPEACRERALAKATELEIMDAQLVKQRFQLLVAQKDASAIEAGHRALFVTPFDGEIRVALAGVLLDRGERAAAKDELALAKLCNSPPAAKNLLDALTARLASH